MHKRQIYDEICWRKKLGAATSGLETGGGFEVLTSRHERGDMIGASVE
jgi:hypothetical protein